MRVWAVVDRDETDRALRREDAERFLEDVRRDDEELAASLRVEPVELDA